MPLDMVNGEPNPEFGSFRIVPTRKWDETEFFHHAAQGAAQAFMASGAMWPVHFNEAEILCQEYLRAGKLEFVFFKQIGGEDYYYRHHWDLDEHPDLIAELVTDGRWEVAPASIH